MSRARIRAVVGMIGVLGAAGAAAADVTSFTDQAGFEAHMAAQGNILQDVEDFEDFGLMQDELVDTSALALFNTGLLAPGLVLGNNEVGPLTVDSPVHGPLQLIGPFPTFGVPSGLAIVPSDNSTLDILFGALRTLTSPLGGMMFDGGRSGVGLDVTTFGPNVTVRVFGADGVTLLGEFGGVAGGPGGSFFGVASTDPIGRINIASTVALNDGALGHVEGADNIQMWVVPAPGACALIGLGGMFAVRRRRVW